MTQIGTIKGQEVKKNRDGSIAVRLLQVQISNESDMQTVQYMNPSGEDSAPINGDKVQIFQIGSAFKFAVSVEDQVNAAVSGDGEKRFRCRDENTGAILAFLNLLSSGNLELNGNAKSAVRYQDLQTQFDELKSAFNSHVHTNPEGGNVGAAVPQSAADITTVESPTVKLP